MLLVAPPHSYRIAPYIQAAQRLGIHVLVASEGEHSLVSEIASGVHVDFSNPTEAVQKILAVAGPVSGVLGSDDVTVPIAARIAEALGLVHNPVQASELSRRKDLARSCLQQAGVPVPAHCRIPVSRPAEPPFPYPCVVKPLSLSGSRGVIRADDWTQLWAACARIERILQAEGRLLSDEERSQVLVEQFIAGEEVALEGMLSGGRLQTLALFDKPEPLNGPFFEESYYITPSRLAPEVQERVARRVAEACAAYGLREGPVHAELRLSGGEAWIIEVAARTIGGQCARLLRFGIGHGLEELVLSHAVGALPPLQARAEAAGVLMIPIPKGGILRRVEGVLQALRVSYVEDLEISVREGYELTPLPEGASYLGFIFARGPTPAAVEQALRQAHSCLRVVTAPVFPIAGTPH